MSVEPSLSSEPRLKLSPVDVRRFPWIRPLAGDYAYNFKQVEGLYAGNPLEADAWRQAVARAQQQPRDRARLASVLQAQQVHRNAPAEARAAAARLADPNAVAVVTGQQAGVFGGPMYTLLKAITALQLARRTEHKQKVPAVTVFWVEAEDHDWNEVRSCTVFESTSRRRIRRFDASHARARSGSIWETWKETGCRGFHGDLRTMIQRPSISNTIGS